jgi:hypothetical protein
MASCCIVLAVLVLVAILAGLAGFYLRKPAASADSIERIPAYQNEALLARARVLPVARLYGPQGYLFQQNPSVCGPTSIADVMRSEGVAADPAAILGRSHGLQIFGFLPFGLTFDEAGLLERETGKLVKELRDLSLESFRAEIAKSNDPSRRIIINFLRTPLFDRGHGDFSPVLGYLPAEDLVFVGDVNSNYGPWLVPTSRPYDAQNTVDSSSRAKRGLLKIYAS